jgi:hypothetical protein
MAGDWFKFYEDTIHDPKLLKLSDALYRAWTVLLCFASKNGGTLPPAEDIAIALREKPAKVGEWISKLKLAGLFDQVDGKFIPHNWEGRQYKVADPTAADRMQRYRKRKGGTVTDRNVTPVTDVTELRLEVEVEKEVEKNSEANASGAEAPDHRKRLFSEGLDKLRNLTGKGPDACRSFVGKCLRAAGDDAVTVLGLIEDAERNQVVDPSAWIAARLKGPENGKPKAGIIQAADNLIAKLASFDGPPRRTDELRSGAGETPVRLLSNR